MSAPSAPSASSRLDLGLEIDWTRCDGHGLCAALLPGVHLDEWGFPLLHAPALASADERDLRRAVAACPALALRLTPTRTGLHP
jgi:ferredoxin